MKSTKEVLEEILAHGHGGGNFRRLLIMAIAKAEKNPVPCCGHPCCCNNNYVKSIQDE